MNGNWSQSDMTSSLGASTTQAAVALTAFWAMVTLGRLLFAATGRWLTATTVFRLLPVVLVGTFLLTAGLPDDMPGLSVAGGVIAFYQLGYGIAAFGVGPLVDSGTDLSVLYGLTAVAALVMTVLAFAIVRGGGGPSGLPEVTVHQGGTRE
jgi:hypothetical protein